MEYLDGEAFSEWLHRDHPLPLSLVVGRAAAASNIHEKGQE